jgi:outer membrane lipoprotein-sorting protein
MGAIWKDVHVPAVRCSRSELFLWALGAALAFTAPARADEGREKLEGAKLDRALAEVTQARRELKTLRASFTQTRKIALLAASVSSRGEMIYGAPDRLRWDLAPPDDIVYFVGPEGLSYRTKSSSATLPNGNANAAKALTDVRALLGGDIGALRERYVLGGSRTASELEIVGAAKDPAASVKAFTLVLDKGLVVPIRARLLENKNDSVDLTFSNAIVNGPVDPKLLKP